MSLHLAVGAQPEQAVQPRRKGEEAEHGCCRQRVLVQEPVVVEEDDDEAGDGEHNAQCEVDDRASCQL